jgi:signal transduction histidine kinase
MVALAQELRTPLTSIMGYNEMLLRESMGLLVEGQRQFVQRIQVNVEQLMHMIENLIRVPAIDRGNLSLAPNKIDVEDLIDDAITSSSAQYREKGLTLHLEIAPELPDIVADRDAMHQMLTRLLTNAYLASPADSAVMVEAAHWPAQQIDDSDDGRDVIYFGITDQGGGIKQEDIKRVFARHFRAENPLIEGLGDKGAGLAVARALVEAHGGKIWVEADPGKSTTFKVLIPVDHHFGEKDLMRGRVSRLIESLKKGDDDTPARAKFLPEETET